MVPSTIQKSGATQTMLLPIHFQDDFSFRLSGFLILEGGSVFLDAEHPIDAGLQAASVNPFGKLGEPLSIGVHEHITVGRLRLPCQSPLAVARARKKKPVQGIQSKIPCCFGLGFARDGNHLSPLTDDKKRSIQGVGSDEIQNKIKFFTDTLKLLFSVIDKSIGTEIRDQ